MDMVLVCGSSQHIGLLMVSRMVAFDGGMAEIHGPKVGGWVSADTGLAERTWWNLCFLYMYALVVYGIASIGAPHT